MSSLLIDALFCRNLSRPPVWLMRQAGRYMPSYRKLREHHTLWEMFHRPKLAARITLLPLELLHVDAAILFSDILVIAEALGLNMHFPERGGPRILPQISSKEQIADLRTFDVKQSLSYVFETIALVKERIYVPLIGFCGGPFTVVTYMLDALSAIPFSVTKKWIAEDSKSFHLLLEKVTEATIAYVTEQVKTGADVIQIFDSWANILSSEEFKVFCMPYLQRIINSVKDKVPVILFCRDASAKYKELCALNPHCVSLDANCSMQKMRSLIPTHIALQGNISPEILRGPRETLRETLDALLCSMRDEKGFIVNLSHGVLPDTPLAHVQHFVEMIVAN